MKIPTSDVLWRKLGLTIFFLVLLVFAIFLLLVLKVSIEIIDEGLMHEMTIFESEPKEGWGYWKWKAIREALPSWVICGAIWLALFIGTFYSGYRSAKAILN